MSYPYVDMHVHVNVYIDSKVPSGASQGCLPSELHDPAHLSNPAYKLEYALPKHSHHSVPQSPSRSAPLSSPVHGHRPQNYSGSYFRPGFQKPFQSQATASGFLDRARPPPTPAFSSFGQLCGAARQLCQLRRALGVAGAEGLHHREVRSML